MFKKKMLPVAFALASLMAASGASAALITPSVSFTAGTSYTTGAVAGIVTTGYDMAGALVTATFADRPAETLFWAAINLAAGQGGASSTNGWSLSMSGNSNVSPWQLEFATDFQGVMVGLSIDLRPASALFDVIVTPEQTPGSDVGSNILESNGGIGSANWMDGPNGLIVAGTYGNRVGIRETTGDTFYGDLYLTLDLSFSRTTGRNGLGAGDLLVFRSDTDRLATAGDLVIPGDNGNGNGNGGNPVPVPGTLALLGLGLLGLGVRRQRK